MRAREVRDDQAVRALLADGQLVVVETDDDLFLGTAEVTEGFLVIRSGFVGRPVVLAAEDVRSVIPADEHPGVLTL